MKKYFSQYDFKVDFFPPITLHVGSKLALREYCAHHSSLLMYRGVSFGSFSSVRPMTDIVPVSVSVDLKDFLLTRKVMWKKRSQSIRNDWQSDDIIKCSKPLQIEAY